MNKLIVFLGAARVGVLKRKGRDSSSFTYDPAWLEHPDAIPLSRSLPLQGETFSPKKAKPFFSGVLPEEGPKRKIAAILGISETNDFGLLEKIGGECAGAIRLLPTGADASETAGENSLELSEFELSAIIDELPRRPLMAGKEGVRLSLAGAQDKLPVLHVSDRFFLPLENTPSTHIIKPEPERFPGLAANEAYCMTLAKLSGLGVPHVRYVRIGRKPCVLVQRYDRKVDADGEVHRLHQEDFCQALGFPPGRKYQAEGGPSIKDCVSLLRDWSSAPVVDIRDFLDGIVFNAIIGNADAHAKNFSFLYDRGERRFAPLYDLICTLAWDELSRNLAMKIGGCKHVNAIMKEHWRKMAESSGLGWPMTRERIRQLGERILTNLGPAREKVKNGDENMIERVHAIVSQRAQVNIAI